MKTTLRTIATQYRQKTSACFEATDTTVHAKFTASRLLGPEEALQLVKDAERPRDIEQLPAWLKPIRDQTGASTETILRRLVDQNRVTKDYYDQYRTWMVKQLSDERAEKDSGSRAYRYREPLHIFGKDYVGAILKALGHEQITTVRANKCLDNLKLDDLRKLEDAYIHPSS